MTSSGRGGGTNFGLRKKALGLSRKASQEAARPGDSHPNPTAHLAGIGRGYFRVFTPQCCASPRLRGSSEPADIHVPCCPCRRPDWISHCRRLNFYRARLARQASACSSRFRRVFAVHPSLKKPVSGRSGVPPRCRSVLRLRLPARSKRITKERI